MARTTEEIKQVLETEFMTRFRSLYGIPSGRTFGSYFSSVSVENLLLYVMAKLCHSLEEYMDAHEQRVEEYIAGMKPHSLRWYVQKILDFQWGIGTFDPEYGTYDNSDEDEEDVAASKVVKYASGTEGGATLYIKVAGESGGARQPLSANALIALYAYVGQVKDAGVRVVLVNEPAEQLGIILTVHYDPLVLNSSGKLLSDTSVKPVEQAVKNYISNLPFNGVFSKDALVDAVQQAQGVKVTDLTAVHVSGDGQTYRQMTAAYAQPYPGYYELDDAHTQITYTAYPY
ncbi:MAG: hypothetical protein IJT12_04010 [Paludibacteraceae bacterium]|nr:hypothetical protein [Paludibacteraceae bacterium]